MADFPIVEALFQKRRSRTLSIYSTAKDSEDLNFIEEYRVKIKFSVVANTSYGWGIKISGSVKELGNWIISESPQLSTSSKTYPLWSSRAVVLTTPSFPITIEYKYILVDPSGQIQWESISKNRVVKIYNKASKNYLYEVKDKLNRNSKADLFIKNKSSFAENLSKLVTLSKLEEQLAGLSDILTTAVMSFNTLALACIAIRNLKNPMGNDYSAYIPFIDWCSNNLSVQQTKILLSATSPTYIWLAVSNSDSDISLKINAYQDAYLDQLSDEDLLNSLANLRLALVNEYDSSNDIAGFLITDIYLEKSQLSLLERFLEGINYSENSKIIQAGKWISQLLLLQSIKPKQVSTIINQFEKLSQEEHEEVLRDLLNELSNLVIEVYLELFQKVDHKECETLASVLMSEYKILYEGIFKLASLFLLKCFPILNDSISSQFFYPFSCGCSTGKVFFWKDGMKIPKFECLLVANCLPEDLEIPLNVTGVVLSVMDSLYHPGLLESRKRGVPILVGVFNLVLVEKVFKLMVSEESYSLQIEG